MTIGRRISDKRKALKITQGALADAVGVTTAFISQIETGSRKPSYGLMLKLAHELGVNLDSLFSDSDNEELDPIDKVIFSTIPFLEPENKRKILEHIFLLSGTKFYNGFPFLTSATEYAQYIIRNCKIKDVPVNIYQVADSLGVRIVKADLGECEGLLYKTSESPLILLNINFNHLEREKFTIAILLGHLVIPWHLKQTFYRYENKRSLDIDEQLEMEARQFAGELVLPGLVVKKDFKQVAPSIEIFEKLAAEKYKCSMTALAHKYTEYYGTKCVYLTSNNNSITRSYATSFPFRLVDEVSDDSIAHTFIVEPPDKKETRRGTVRASVWFKDAPASAEVIEESMLDPIFGVTVSLLQLK